MEALVLGFLGRGDGGNALAELLCILSVFTLTEKLVDDLLLEEPTIEHALFFYHVLTSLFFCFKP